jgi:hypothetical protein
MYALAFHDRDWSIAGRQLPIHENDRLGAIHPRGGGAGKGPAVGAESCPPMLSGLTSSQQRLQHTRDPKDMRRRTNGETRGTSR